MRFMPIWLIIIFFTTVAPASIEAAVISGTIGENTTWVAAESPYQIDGVVEVRYDVILTIEPGVTIMFNQDAGLLVDGHIVALGTESDSIRFTSADSDVAGSWDGISLNGATEEASWTEDGKFTGTGSVMRYCIIEYAGKGFVAFGSALAINSSSPLIHHTRITNCTGETGTIRCGNLAQALISNCYIANNSATRGGAVSLGVGSQTVLRNNVIALNSAEENGGAIYLALAEAELTGNSFISNRAGGHGAVIYAAESTKLVITGNSLLGNYSEFDSPGFYFTGNVNTDITANVVEISHNAIYLQGAILDVNAPSNYWGRPDKHDFRTAFRDKTLDSAEPFVHHTPALWAPPVIMPTNPIKVSQILLCRTDDYLEEIPRGVADGVPMRIRLVGEDVNPLIADVIQVKVVSTLDPDGILVPLFETEASSGVFIGRGSVAVLSGQTTYTIGDEIGGVVTIFAQFADSVKAEYATMSAKPLVQDYTILDVEDIQHLVNHTPRFAWEYFEVFERPQTHYRFRVFGTDDSGGILPEPIWDTGEFAASKWELEYAGPDLEDGHFYIGRLELYSGYIWSDPADLSFRFNSLPTAPEPNEPDLGWLSDTKNPNLSVFISKDGESDDLTYSFEVYSLNDMSSAVQSIDSILSGETIVSWTPTKELTENEGFEFRAKASDPFEDGSWGENRKFWINSLEEPADAFNLASPIHGDTIYSLHPELTWSEAIDPDPLSSVNYQVEISKSNDFSDPLTYSDITPAVFVIPDSLDNRTTYYWRTTSIDNTGLTTTADSVESFYVDTTPSVPVMSAPISGEERLHTASLSWEPSTDPNPDDVVVYDIQVYETAKMQKLIAQGTGWDGTEIRVEELDGWDKMVDNRVYYWHLRSRDNHNADSKYGAVGSFFFNRYNDNPNLVTGIQAPADTVMGTSDISFAWGAASDIDLSDTPESLTYEIEAVIGDFDSGDIRQFASQIGASKLTVPLDDNKLWRYRVRSRDDEGAVSTWSPEKTVLVNVAEDHPEPFSQISPQNSIAIFELDSIQFNWEMTTDKDWESSVSYILELTPDGEKTIVLKTEQTSLTFYGGLTNEISYSWRVVAIDNLNLKTNSDGAYSFTTNTTPTTPSAAPMEMELLPTGLISFDGSTDPNPSDKLTYILEIAASESFDQPLVHVENIPHSNQTMSNVIGSLTGQEKLQDDTDYYFRVSAVDNHNYQGSFSQPAKFRFNRENDAPGMPGTPLSPSNNEVIRSQTPEFTWSAATDIDMSDPSEKLSYDIRLDSDGERKQNSRHEFTTSPGVTNFTLPVSLDDNQPWVWQIRARDDENAVSAWSAIQSLVVNVREDPPTSAKLSKPTDGEKLNILGPIKFDWEASTDLDYKSSVSYSVEYGTTIDFSDAQKASIKSNSPTMINGPLQNTTYYWRVIAKDNTGLETVSSPFNFTLDTRPSVPETTLPSSGSELLPDGTISWKAAVDPNPKDKITYTVQIGVGDAGRAGNSDKKVEKSGISATTISLKNAGWIAQQITSAYGDNLACHWRIKAIDNHGIESQWSTASEFVFNALNGPPARVENVISPVDQQEVTNVALSWESVNDPDVTDSPETISYRIELSKDMGFSGSVITNQTSPGVTSFSPKNLSDNSEWYWLITAIDDEGLAGSISNLFSFVYNTKNDAPNSFSLSTPVTGSKHDTKTISFNWSTSHDPDPGDKVTYTLEIAKDASFSMDNKKYSGLKSTQFSPPVTDFSSDGTYYWKVSAKDGEGGFTWANSSEKTPWTLTITLPPPPVDPPASGGP